MILAEIKRIINKETVKGVGQIKFCANMATLDPKIVHQKLFNETQKTAQQFRVLAAFIGKT